MSKLTKNIREEMARKLVQFRYTNEAKELVRLNRSLADRAYAHIYTKDVIAAMEVIQKAVKNSTFTSSKIEVNAGGYRVSIGDALHSRWVKFDQAAHDGYRQVVTRGWDPHNITDEKLIEEIKAFATRYKNFNDTCSTAYSEALSVLETMTTGKKLAEAWPEAIPVIGDLIPEGSRTLPVVQVSAVNAKFGLPPKTPVKETV